MTPSAQSNPRANSSTGHVTTTMQAVVAQQYGSPDVLSIQTIQRPAPGAGEVLVAVRAAGLDRGTWHLMTGLPYAVRLAGYGLRAPKTAVIGTDLAGVVIEVGPHVTRFNVGDEVFGTGSGSFASYAVAPADTLVAKPAGLTFEQAAAMPSSGVTALQALSEVGHLQAGQRVLVIGASGGVGSFAVQIAKALGAEVAGVCSTAKVDLVRSLGADHVLDYTRDDFTDGITRYDLILDLGGNTSLSKLRNALTPRGTLVIGGGETSGRLLGGSDRQLRAMALSPFIKARLTTFVSRVTPARLARLAEIAAGGAVVPQIERTYRLSEVPQAMAHLAAGRARGKLVITP